MSTTVVVDASVALKWVVTERGTEQADALLSYLSTGTVSLAVPEHLVGEVANGLRKRVAQGVLGTNDALDALDAIAALELDFLGGTECWSRTLDAAMKWGVTTYDALYVLLAVDLGAELITADERLADAAVARSAGAAPGRVKTSRHAVRVCGSGMQVAVPLAPT